jgi:hypothetical protein
MLKPGTFRRCIMAAATLGLLVALPAQGQVRFGGDFMMRFYNEKFDNTMDNREGLNYTRVRARLSMDAPIGKTAGVHTDFVTVSSNPTLPARAIGGLGPLSYGISQIYGDMVTPNVPMWDLTRIRVGRQHYSLGDGLTLGDSYYQLNQYDAGRVDLMRGSWTLGLFGSITRQEVTADGYYPKPGSDQLYVAKVESELYDHVLLAYSAYEKQRADFNDNVVFGLGARGHLFTRDIEYSGEFASQDFNTLPGLPDKGGIAYMGGLSYTWSMGPFRTVKAEFRTAGYQGDDPSTREIETFEPYYPAWAWGDRVGYVNGDVGGDYPHDGKRLEGSRIYFSRIYFSPSAWPDFRLQLQYATVDAWEKSNSGATGSSDEYGVKLYYSVNQNVRLQARYFLRTQGGGDADVNDSGVISSSEDKYDARRIVFEFLYKY